MSANPLNNFAFIDSTNLHQGIRNLGWEVDYRKFRKYLYDKYGVKTAYMFIGYDPNNRGLYRFLQSTGYILEFKPILRLKSGDVKGNCDAELVLRAVLEKDNYDKAVIVSGDGDFHCLVDHLEDEDKLEIVLAPSPNACSSLLTRRIPGSIAFVSDQKRKLKR